MNELKKFEQSQIDSLSKGKKIPDFKAGDTLVVGVRIKEGSNERIQKFEGLCIALSNKGLNSNFTLRKITNGEGVERVFPTYSPLVESITVTRRGEVARAKLYYMRGLTGKKARIKERLELETARESTVEEAAAKKDSAENKAE